MIREATNDVQVRSDIKCLLNEKNVEITDKLLIANEFNSNFNNVGKNLAKKIKVPHNVQHFYQRNNVCPVSFYLTPISENEIVTQINTLKNGLSCGEDRISLETIKTKYKTLLRPLSHIINTIFSTGVFPKILKTAVIVPLFKQGNKKLANNYRPISLISTVSKLIEKCIKHKLMSFLEQHKLLSNNQYGFRKDTSTENALCKVTDIILNDLDSGKKVVGIFLDLAKAFDTVAHQILLERLYNMGIRGIANDLFRSYLSDRSHRVKVENIFSDPLKVECGVPQGTVLGPLLFNIYVNSIFSVLDEGNIHCFADDTIIIVNGLTWDLAILEAERAFFKIKRWLDSSFLSLNIDKTKFVTFALTKKGLPDIQYLMLHDSDCPMNKESCKCNNLIERKNNWKYLGIFIDENLSWKDHVNYVTTKVRKLIFKFYELRNVLNIKVLKMIYYSLVESIINYGLVVWGYARKTAMSALEVAQKYVIKIMYFKNKRYPTGLLFQESGLFNLEQLYIKSIVRYMLKNQCYKNMLQHNLNTRNVANNNVFVPAMSHSATQRHICFVGPKLYNVLPLQFKNKSYTKVKQKLKNWILETRISLSSFL